MFLFNKFVFKINKNSQVYFKLIVININYFVSLIMVFEASFDLK